jgi:Ran GTPase-activating protein (RanGAP) involved in mRNA processing and transport
MLAAALKDNEQLKEVHLCDNKMQPNDGHAIANIIKENKGVEVLDLKNNNLQDMGLSYICSGLSEQVNAGHGLKSLCIANNSITASGISYLAKALVSKNCQTFIKFC